MFLSPCWRVALPRIPTLLSAGWSDSVSRVADVAHRVDQRFVDAYRRLFLLCECRVQKSRLSTTGQPRPLTPRKSTRSFLAWSQDTECRQRVFDRQVQSRFVSCRTSKWNPACVHAEWCIDHFISARFREKEANWEHPQYEGGAGTRAGVSLLKLRCPNRGAPQTNASPRTHQSPSRWVDCSSSGSQVARHLPGHRSSVAASPLRCQTGLFAGRHLVSSDGLLPEGTCWTHVDCGESHCGCTHPRQPTPRLIKAVTVYRRIIISLTRHPDSGCRPTARLLRVGCGFSV